MSVSRNFTAQQFLRFYLSYHFLFILWWNHSASISFFFISPSPSLYAQYIYSYLIPYFLLLVFFLMNFRCSRIFSSLRLFLLCMRISTFTMIIHVVLYIDTSWYFINFEKSLFNDKVKWPSIIFDRWYWSSLISKLFYVNINVLYLFLGSASCFIMGSDYLLLERITNTKTSRVHT